MTVRPAVRALASSAACALALAAAPAVAHAGILDLYVQAEGGGGGGLGLSGVQKENDFFSGAAGGLYGAKLGAEVLFTDAWVEHWQFTDLDGITGTWTQFMIGLDVDFPIGETTEGTRPKTFAELGMAVGFGMGTGKQVEPPLDNSELSDKGFIAQLSAGVDHRFTKLVSVGLAVPVTYGYLFKTGDGAGANNTDNQYHQLAVAPMFYLRFKLGVGGGK